MHFFTGANTYTLAEELSRWKHSFREKHGDINLSLLVGKDLLWSDLCEAVRPAPFLGEKRLILVEGMPEKILKDEMVLLPEHVHPATILLITESVPDQRKSLTKFLQKEATIKRFPLLTLRELVPWLQSIAREEAVDLPPDVAAHLVAIVGNDQWHLAQECRKLLSYTNGRPTIADVNVIALPSEKHTVWAMSDLLGKGEVVKAVHFAQTLLKQGEDVFALWNIFLWIIKNMAMQHYKEERMHSFVRRIVEADAALKTGKIKASANETIEIVTLLETMMLRMG